MSIDKSGSPPCGIYIRIDDFSNMLDLIGYVRQMAFTINRGSGYEKNMSVVEVAYTPQHAERAKDIVPIIQDQGLVAIMHGTHEKMGADGVLIDDVLNLPAVRSALGEEAIIGVTCDKSRDDVTRAVEGGADYVKVSADPVFVSLCKGSGDVMCVALDPHMTNDTCGALVRAGADFIEAGPYILGHEKGVMQATVNMLHAIDLASRPPKNLN